MIGPKLFTRMRASASRKGSTADRHVVAVGVEQALGVEHDADMALPEDEVAAPQAGEVGGDGDGLAEIPLLHVAVARRRDPGRVERELDEAGAVEAEAGAAAPEIGRADEALGDGDEIGLGLSRPDEMGGVDEAAAREAGVVALTAGDDLGARRG